jgi:hypothetical protein
MTDPTPIPVQVRRVAPSLGPLTEIALSADDEVFDAVLLALWQGIRFGKVAVDVTDVESMP